MIWGELSDAWGRCLDRREPAFRTTSAFYRVIRNTAAWAQADIVLIDVGPNFGAINRAALICADAIVVPLTPDLFSLQGLRNLGPTLDRWREEWRERTRKNPAPDLELPAGNLRAIGYVLLQFGIRDSRPVHAYDRWAKRIPQTYAKYVLGAPAEDSPDVNTNGHCLGMLKHFRSLMPMAMEARKPVFDLKAADGAIGAHTYAVQNSFADFRNLAERILLEAAQLKE